jgi:hypothetical protein
LPSPFDEAAFSDSLASVVWTQPDDPRSLGPLEDVPAAELSRDWPKARREQLRAALPSHSAMSSVRYDSCAVVGSSPELLMYTDGAEIDAHEARTPLP